MKCLTLQMKGVNSILFLVLSILPVAAQGILEIGSTRDLWDVSSGTIITAHSGEAPPYHMENAFGARLGTIQGNSLFDAIFTDGRPAGFVHFVEWKTPKVVTVRAIRLHAQGDGAVNDNGREFDLFTLKTKSAGSAKFDTVICSYAPPHPYNYKDYSQRLIFAATVAAFSGQEFRAEFTDRGNRFWSGPRIIELDGFAEETPLAIHPAVELVFATRISVWYQIQQCDDLVADKWVNFGSPFMGDGEQKRAFDSARADGGVRYYRIVELTASPVTTRLNEE